MVGPKELLYFADVCAGPGGFSEYVLYRKKWKAKGFGFTLKGDHDFRYLKSLILPSCLASQSKLNGHIKNLHCFQGSPISMQLRVRHSNRITEPKKMEIYSIQKI